MIIPYSKLLRALCQCIKMVMNKALYYECYCYLQRHHGTKRIRLITKTKKDFDKNYMFEMQTARSLLALSASWQFFPTSFF